MLADPHGPVLSAVGYALEFPTVSLDAHAHHHFSSRMGLTVGIDGFTTRPVFVRATHVGLRIGTRISLRNRGLNDWAVSPFVIGGVSTLSTQSRGRMARYGVLGLGAQLSRTWVWKHFVFELGAGAYGSAPFAYTSRAQGLQDAEPDALLPIKPLLNGSLGYAF